jgi:hypothetical protein
LVAALFVANRTQIFMATGIAKAEAHARAGGIDVILPATQSPGLGPCFDHPSVSFRHGAEKK